MRHQLHIGVSAEEAREIRAAARAAGLSLSEWARGYLLRGARWEAGGGDPGDLDDGDGGIELAPVEDPARALERRILARLRTLPQPSDVEIAEALDTTPHVVRLVRRQAGIPGVRRHGESGWQDRLRELHAEGLTVDEIVSETGWSRRTVQQRHSTLRLRCRYLPRDP